MQLRTTLNTKLRLMEEDVKFHQLKLHQRFQFVSLILLQQYTSIVVRIIVPSKLQVGEIAQ